MRVKIDCRFILRVLGVLLLVISAAWLIFSLAIVISGTLPSYLPLSTKPAIEMGAALALAVVVLTLAFVLMEAVKHLWNKNPTLLSFEIEIKGKPQKDTEEQSGLPEAKTVERKQ